MSRELRDVIMNYITSLRPFGGKNLPSADFALMSLDHNELRDKYITTNLQKRPRLRKRPVTARKTGLFVECGVILAKFLF